MRLALVPLLLLLLALFAPMTAAAQQNPLLGGQAPANQDQAPVADEGILHRLEGFVIAAQSYFMRAIDRQLVAIRDGHGFAVILSGLAIAFLYGVFHALGPGHGKTIIVGYFLGRGGSIGRGLAMASWISLSHVIGAIVIIGVAHFILAHSLLTPVEENWWLRLISYGAILAIGLFMLIRALAGRGHMHAHGHGHDHDHDHAHDHAHHARRRREQRLLAVAAGFLPCSGAVLILLFAFGNGMLMIGVLMTLTIAFGMGLTLAALGIASLLTHRHAIARFGGTDRAASVLALLGPILISLIGAILFSGTLLNHGPY